MGLPGSPALPPWHSAAGRVVRKRDGKGLGPLTPKNIKPQFESCQGSERAIFIRILTKLIVFIGKGMPPQMGKPGTDWSHRAAISTYCLRF